MEDRGGSFNNESRNVRCANRNRNNPNNRNNNIGFRLVVSTRFADLPKGRHGYQPLLLRHNSREKHGRAYSWPDCQQWRPGK